MQAALNRPKSRCKSYTPCLTLQFTRCNLDSTMQINSNSHSLSFASQNNGSDLLCLDSSLYSYWF